MSSYLPEMNAIAQLEFELVYYDEAFRYISHCATGNQPLQIFDILLKNQNSIRAI